MLISQLVPALFQVVFPPLSFTAREKKSEQSPLKLKRLPKGRQGNYGQHALLAHFLQLRSRQRQHTDLPQTAKIGLRIVMRARAHVKLARNPITRFLPEGLVQHLAGAGFQSFRQCRFHFFRTHAFSCTHFDFTTAFALGVVGQAGAGGDQATHHDVFL